VGEFNDKKVQNIGQFRNLFTLLIAAAALQETRESTVKLVDLQERKSKRKAAKKILNIFFWILFILLTLIILTRYLV
jgi:hypothetical protein